MRLKFLLRKVNYLLFLTITFLSFSFVLHAQIDFCNETYIRPAGLDSIEHGESSFGVNVHIDGTTAIIGALSDKVAGWWAGSAYIYELENGEWREVTKLYASDPQDYDEFGHQVFIKGNTALVGVWYHDHDGLRNLGAVYVYEKLDGVWTNTQELTPSDGEAGDLFGVNMEIDGNTIIVGALGDDEKGNLAGAAYVFDKVDGIWEETVKLTASDGAPVDLFGVNVSISNNVLVVGAWGKSDVLYRAGAAYVYEKINGSWTEVAKLLPSFPRRENSFGIRCGIEENTIIIGASPIYGTGRVYVYEKPSTGWTNMTETAILSASENATAGDRFGLSLDINGDFVIVGAEDDNVNGEDSGAAYVFQKPEDGWITATEDLKLLPENGGAKYDYGISVSVSGNQFIVGSRGDRNVDARFSGSVYIYENCIPDFCQNTIMEITGDSLNGREINSGNYRVSNEIIATGIIPSSKTVTFTAENAISLKNGFSVSKGGSFSCEILSCSEENTQQKEQIYLKQDLIKQNKIELSKFEISPNPVSEENVTISFNLIKGEKVNLCLYDQNGQLLQEIYKEEIFFKGLHNKIIKTPNLENGTYFISLKTTSSIETKKLIILK